MTVLMEWHDREHTILRYTLAQTWTWDELYEVIAKGSALAASVPHTVDVIVDFQNSRGLPPKAFAQFTRISQLPTQSDGLIVLAGGGTFILSIFNLFKLILGSAADRYSWAINLEQAEKILATRRALLIR